MLQPSGWKCAQRLTPGCCCRRADNGDSRLPTPRGIARDCAALITGQRLRLDRDRARVHASSASTVW